MCTAPLLITPWISSPAQPTSGDAGLLLPVGPAACAKNSPSLGPSMEPTGAPPGMRTQVISHLGQGDGQIMRAWEGLWGRRSGPPTSFPRCWAERLSRSVYTFPQTEISRQTPGAESSEKPPAGCITRTPLVVRPSIRPSGVRHLAARSWDHMRDPITSLGIHSRLCARGATSVPQVQR